MGGLEEKEFQESNPKTYAEINAAWSLLTDYETQPYLILGVSKDNSLEQIQASFVKLHSHFPPLLFPDDNFKISRAYGLLVNPEHRIFVDFFSFDESLWNLWLLEEDNEISVRREIEKQFSGSICKQIINSTLFCYLKACHIEETKQDFDLSGSFWKKAYLGWQGILQEGFIWEDLRERVLKGQLFSRFSIGRFDDDCIQRIKDRLTQLLVDNAVDRCMKTLKHSVQATIDHLKFLKYFPVREPQQRKAIARMYNQCAFILSRDGRLEEARELLEEALRLDPDLVEGKTNYELARSATSGIGQALRLLTRKKEQEARELLQKVVDENPEDNDARELFATLQHKMAREAYRDGLFNEAFTLLSSASQYRDTYQEELNLVKRARQKALLIEAMQFFKNEEYERAISILRKYITEYPDQNEPKVFLARLLNRLAIAKNRQRQWLEARNRMNEALLLEPENEVFRSNLAQVEKAAENQQTANDITRAIEMVEEGRPKEAINLLEPIYTRQVMPPAITEEIRKVLASAYLAQGKARAKEVKNAVSKGEMEEAFESAHASITIADFLESGDEVRENLAMLEDALPTLLDKVYDESLFPQPPSGDRKLVIKHQKQRMWKKKQGRARNLVSSYFKRVFSTIRIPLLCLPVAVGFFLLCRFLGGDMPSSLAGGLLFELGGISLFMVQKMGKKGKPFLILFLVCLVLALGNLGRLSLYRRVPTKPRRISPRKPPDGPRQPEKTPVETPVPTLTPFQEIPEGPGFFYPITALFKKGFGPRTRPVAIKDPDKTPEPARTPTPAPTPTPKPSRVGKTVDIKLMVQNFIGVRQDPRPVFLYRITTPDGPATLILDPLVYIKIQKDKLEPGQWKNARVRVIREEAVNIYELQSPSDLDSE